MTKEMMKEINEKNFNGFDFENLKQRQPLQRLVFENYRKLKDWLKKKTPSEQLEKVKRELTRDEAYLNDLQNADTMKQIGDWQYAENSLILKSQLVCCTLSMAGIEKMNIGKDLFDYLIIDEAC